MWKSGDNQLYCPPGFISETESDKPGAGQDNKLGGQSALGVHLTLPSQCWLLSVCHHSRFFYVGAGN